MNEAAALRPSRVLAWSECRADAPEIERPGIALWRPEGVTVAIGLSQKPETELEVEAMRRDGVDLIRRQSGGGAVLLYDGVLCWEAWAPLEAVREALGDSGIRPSYAFLCRPVIAGLGVLGITAISAGICDISVEEGGGALRKVAGTAQLRRKQNVLVHGSLLVAPDMNMLPRYLKFPSDQPDYRHNRSHRDFCVSLAELLDAPASGDVLVAQAAEHIEKAAADAGWSVEHLGATPTPVETALENDKYRRAEWNWDKARR